jgi:TATA element modulatory factor
LRYYQANEGPDSSRASSKTRTNDRLQARLAKAVARGGASPTPTSKAPSETASPNTQSPAISATVVPRSSIDSQPHESQPESKAQFGLEAAAKAGAAQEDAGTIVDETSDPAKFTAVQPSSDSTRQSLDAVQPTEVVADADTTVTDNFYTESEAAQKIKEQAEEIHLQLEKIDRLHANIAYLSSQLYDNASATVAAAKSGSQEKNEADKDVKIAQLLEEGGKLSKTEEKLRGDIKYLRSRLQDEKKSSLDVTKRLEKAENEIRDLRIAIQSSETREKVASERIVALSSVERELETLRSEKNEAQKESEQLRRALQEAERRADDADKQAQSQKLDQQMRLVSELNDELSNARIEKRLIEDRVKSEMKDIKEEHNRQIEKAKISEVELKAEIQVCRSIKSLHLTGLLVNLIRISRRNWKSFVLEAKKFLQTRLRNPSRNYSDR